MKKLWVVTVLVVSLLFFLGGLVQASKDIVISDSNEYGGKTWETTFEKGEEEYDIYKKVTAYWDSKKIRKLESFFTDKIAKEKGVYLAITYFDSNGKKIKDEHFTTEEEIKRTDFEKSVTYFDSNGIKTKTENFCVDKLVKKDGMVKVITYYKGGKIDKTTTEFIYSAEYAKENGYNREKVIYDIIKRTRTSQYFMDDKLIKTEEMKVP